MCNLTPEESNKENITISEEVQPENKDTASKPRSRLSSSEPCILHALNEENQKPLSEETRQEFMDTMFAKLHQISEDLNRQNQIKNFARF